MTTQRNQCGALMSLAAVTTLWLSLFNGLDGRSLQESVGSRAPSTTTSPVVWPNCATSPLNTAAQYDKFRQSIRRDDQGNYTIGALGSVVFARSDLGFKTIADDSAIVAIGIVARCEVRLEDTHESALTRRFGHLVNLQTDYEIKIDEVLKGSWKPGRVITVEDRNAGRMALPDGTWAATTIQGFVPLNPGSRYVLFLQEFHSGDGRDVTRLVERANPGGLWQFTSPGISAFELRPDGTVGPATSITIASHLATAYRGVRADKFLADVRSALSAK